MLITLDRALLAPRATTSVSTPSAPIAWAALIWVVSGPPGPASVQAPAISSLFPMTRWRGSRRGRWVEIHSWHQPAEADIASRTSQARVPRLW
jgi:hypothetical protein